MLNLLARVYWKFGLVAVHVTVVCQKQGLMRETDSTFPTIAGISKADIHLGLFRSMYIFLFHTKCHTQTFGYLPDHKNVC